MACPYLNRSSNSCRLYKIAYGNDKLDKSHRDAYCLHNTQENNKKCRCFKQFGN